MWRVSWNENRDGLNFQKVSDKKRGAGGGMAYSDALTVGIRRTILIRPAS